MVDAGRLAQLRQRDAISRMTQTSSNPVAHGPTKGLLRRLADASRVPPKELLHRQIHKLIRHHLNNRKGGILHIGGADASEAVFYGDRPVIWFEANPEVMPLLLQNIAAFPNQRAFCVLLGDERREIDFHIASNGGSSSSIFALGKYSAGRESLWPDLNLHMEKTIRLEMQTLDGFWVRHGIAASAYQHWVLDVQGAELLVLKGASNSLRHCKVISLEVSTVEVYEGGVQYPEIRDYFITAGFIPLAEPKGKQHCDVTFVHRSLWETRYFRSLMALLSRTETRPHNSELS
jgi:FkbM family methyltransferase